MLYAGYQVSAQYSWGSHNEPDQQQNIPKRESRVQLKI